MIKNWIVRKLGLKGSWSWACKQMKNGKIVKPSNITGSVKYKLDNECQQRICYTFARNIEGAKWDNANIFLSDFERTDWIIFV